MSANIFEHLSNLFKEEIKAQTDNLADGSAKDFCDYKYTIGILRGLWIANAIVAQVAERYEEVE